MKSRRELIFEEIFENTEKNLDSDVKARIVSVQAISSGIGSTLYIAGKKLGESLIKNKANSIETALESHRDAIEKYIGNFEYESGKIIVRDCKISSGLPNIGVTLCHFESGIIAGVLKSVGEYAVYERKCHTTGAGLCEHVIKKIEGD